MCKGPEAGTQEQQCGWDLREWLGGEHSWLGGTDIWPMEMEVRMAAPRMDRVKIDFGGGIDKPCQLLLC